MRLCADCIKLGGLVHTNSRDMQVILRLALVSKTVCTTVCVTLQLHTEHVASYKQKEMCFQKKRGYSIIISADL